MESVRSLAPPPDSCGNAADDDDEDDDDGQEKNVHDDNCFSMIQTISGGGMMP